MALCYLNGHFVPLAEAGISPLDRGFLFGDAVYEVIPVYSGTPFRTGAHLQRLERSLSAVRIPSPMPPDHWHSLFSRLIAAAGTPFCSLYLQITRGAPADRDHAFPPATTPTVFVMTAPLPDTRSDRASGVRAVTRADLRWERCDIKSTSLLANVLLRQEAVEAGAAESILLRGDRVTEGAASNVFLVRDGRIITPELDTALLPGITREVVRELLEPDHPVETRTVHEADLRDAEEIWIASSTKEALPVVELDGEAVGDRTPGPIYRELMGRFDRTVRTAP